MLGSASRRGGLRVNQDEEQLRAIYESGSGFRQEIILPKGFLDPVGQQPEAFDRLFRLDRVVDMQRLSAMELGSRRSRFAF